MKIALSLIAIFLFIVTSSAQSRTISKDEYEKVFEFAVSKTNEAYPVIFNVTTVFFENGRRVRTVMDLSENESRSHHRISRTIIAEGRMTNKFQVSVGFGKVFCSDDSVSWKPSKHECWGPVSIYGRRDTESVEYRLTVKWTKRKKVRVYRQYSVFAPWEGSNKKEFRKTVSTINTRGFFMTVVDTEGTLDPKTVTLIRKQSWVTKAKIKLFALPSRGGGLTPGNPTDPHRQVILQSARAAAPSLDRGVRPSCHRLHRSDRDTVGYNYWYHTHPFEQASRDSVTGDQFGDPTQANFNDADISVKLRLRGVLITNTSVIV
jgi:hypothetical protein